MKNSTSSLLFAIMLLLLIPACNKSTLTVHLDINLSAPQIEYGVARFAELDKLTYIRLSEDQPDLIIRARIDSVNLVKEAYKVSVSNNEVEIIGGDPVGVMYGLAEVRNQLRTGKRKVESIEESPNLDFRAIKFNLPWDSYRRSPALDLHFETARDITFWESFLDMMADNRFNALTLWNLHPFSYMVKTEKYPEGCSLSDEELVEWQEFWTTLFRMAKDRGIETYLVNWNIFVSPEFAKAHNVCDYCIEGEFNVPVGDTSEIIKDFTRESVKAVIDTYPDLTGLGITLGEGMGGMTPEERAEWILESFIDGARLASRKIKFIYRVPLSAGTSSDGSTSVEVEKMTRATLDTLTCFDGPIKIELKFNWSHAFSTPHLIKVHGGDLNDVYWNPFPTNHYLAWMMRNEDFFMLRWGQTEFLRRHMYKNVHPHVNGYFVGSETYIPAKDYMTALPNTSNKYAFDRQWMYYKTLGRMFYNPETPDQTFIDEFEYRFPDLGSTLFFAQQKASKVPLFIGSWWNGSWDMALYSEGMMSQIRRDGKRSFELISIQRFANRTPMDPDYMSIDDYLANESNGDNGKVTPFQLADSLTLLCKEAIDAVKHINVENDVDLRYEVADIKSWSYLGLYFSNKLRAGVEYRRFLLSRDKNDLNNAIEWFTEATQNWRSLVEVTSPVYNIVPLVHFAPTHPDYGQELFHWSILEEQVLNQLEWLKSMR